MISDLRAKGIQDNKLLEVMEDIPRHLFVDRGFEEWAYKDQAFPIGEDQTISQPYTVAYMTQWLEPQAEDKVLEIGTGSGYQAAILSRLCRKVYTLERFESLYEKATKRLEQMGYDNVRTFFSDGHEGLPRFAPYDKILVTAGTDSIPEPLKEQLVIGGLMVIPVGSGASQVMTRLHKISEDEFDIERKGAFRFVPFKKGTEED